SSTRSRFVRSETVRTRAARRTARGTTARKTNRSFQPMSSRRRTKDRSCTVTTQGQGGRSGSAYCVWQSEAPSRLRSLGSVIAMRSPWLRPRSPIASTSFGTRSGRRVTAAIRSPAASCRRHRGSLRGSPRRSGGHRLDDGQAEPLVQGNVENTRSAPVEPGELGVRNLADPPRDVDLAPPSCADHAQLDACDACGLHRATEVLARLECP